MIGNVSSKDRLFVHYFIPYIIILLLPILLGSIIHNKTVNMIEENSKEKNILLLERSMNALDQRVNEIEMIVSQILSNSHIRNFTFKEDPYDYPGPYSINKTRESMYSVMPFNSFILDYYVLFDKSSLVLAPGFTYTYSQFYDMILQYKGMDYEGWHKLINEQSFYKSFMPSSLAKYKGKQLSLITYMHTITGFPVDNKALIIVMIDENEFMKHLTGIDIDGGGWVYIADEQGNIITGLAPEDVKIASIDIDSHNSKGVVQKDVNGEDMIVSFVSSAQTGWRYVAVQPSSVVISKVEYIKNIIYSVILLTIFIGLTIAYYMAYRNTVPIKDIIKNISNSFRGELPRNKNGFTFINDTILTLLNDSESMQAAIEQQIPFLKASIFDSLLKGKFQTQEEINILLKYTGIDMAWNNYGVIILQLLDDNDEELSHEILTRLENKKLVIKEAIKSIVQHSIYFHDIDNNKIAVFLCCPENQKDYKQYIDSIKNEIDALLPKSYKNSIAYAIGELYEDIMQIPSSYKQAMYALRFFIRGKDDHVLHYSEMATDVRIYYYPIDIEERLINLTKSGDLEAVKDQLNKLYTENLLKRKISKTMMHLFIYELLATLMKTFDYVSIDDQVHDIMQQFESLEAYEDSKKLEIIIDMYCSLCKAVTEQKNSRINTLVDSIYNYINDSYMNPDLSLMQIAEEFNMTETYITVLFKKETGKNIYEYIESTRINHAANLLINTRMNVSEIANKVGFYSINTFGRAFKRVKGVNATTFRREFKT